MFVLVSGHDGFVDVDRTQHNHAPREQFLHNPTYNMNRPQTL